MSRKTKTYARTLREAGSNKIPQRQAHLINAKKSEKLRERKRGNAYAIFTAGKRREASEKQEGHSKHST